MDMSSFSLEGKIALITGASYGIGMAIAKGMAAAGATIVFNDIKQELVDKGLAAYEEAGIKAHGYVCDVTNEDAVNELVAKIEAEVGVIDILVNNAGISMRALFEDLELDVIRRLMDVNFWGTVYCTKFALPYILKTKGSLVGIISVAGFLGLPGRTGYSASKFAVRGFLNTLRVENLKKGLHVLVAAPGFTASNIRKTALVANGHQQGDSPRAENKMMSAERCAQIIVNGVVKRKREIVMTLVEGKISVFLSKWFPSLLDKLAYSHMAKEPDSPFK